MELPTGCQYRSLTNNKFRNDNGWGGISCALICAIPIVAIICDTVKKVFEMKYKKEERKEYEYGKDLCSK